VIDKDLDYEVVGEFMQRLLVKPDWLQQRVDTVTFVDSRNLTRQSTFDIETRLIAVDQPHGLVPDGFCVVPLETGYRSTSEPSP